MLSRVASVGGTIAGSLTEWFPLPEMLFPRAAGIDISDTSVKWIVLEGKPGDAQVEVCGHAELPSGAVVNGVVEDAHALVDALHDVRNELGGIRYVHAGLPEEAAYVFGMHVPSSSSRKQILSMIEFELEGRVPIAPGAAVYDFDRVETRADGSSEEISVVVFPRDLAESYAHAFKDAGLALLSLELESRSAARAVSSGRPDEPITMLVDFGRLRTGLAVLKRGIPIFTSTVQVGGEMIDRAISEKLSLSPEDATTFKNEEGLLAKGGKSSRGLEAISGTAAALADEIMRHYHYWDTRRSGEGDRTTPVEQVFLIGGSANLKGLGDYIAGRVQAEVVRPNVWQHVNNFDGYVPPIDRRTSLEYATAVGLALRNFSL